MWSKRFIEWTNGDTAYLSVVFTWDLPQAYQRAVWLGMDGYDVKAGGPAVMLMPEYLSAVAECTVRSPRPVIHRHNSWATKTSLGCCNACPFCAVPKIEGQLLELREWPVRPIVCDNNLLACSRRHFDDVVDKLKRLRSPFVDFNQGLDARKLTKHHATRLAELNCIVRLAFDSVSYESAFMRAFERLRAAGIPKSRIRVYVLCGFNDTPEDALYRLKTVTDLGIEPNPMRYNPLDTLVRDSYIPPNWTTRELRRMVRYWANLRYFRAVPFEDFDLSESDKRALLTKAYRL